MHCPQCGKELPKESQFCPYCMTKFTEAVKIETLSLKKKRKKSLLICISAAFVIVAVACAVIVPKLLKDNISSSKQTGGVADMLGRKSSARQGSDNIFTPYIGEWVVDIKSGVDRTTVGSDTVVIKIKSAEEDTVTFDVTQTYLDGGTVFLSDCAAKIGNGNASYDYQNDGSGSGGNIIISVVESGIFARSVMTGNYVNGKHFFNFEYRFTRREDIEPADITNYLGKNKLTVAQNDFGGYNNSFEKVETVDEYETHNFGPFGVCLNTYLPEYVYIVFLTFNPINRSDFTFKGLDGNSTRDDVIEKLGKPMSESGGFLVSGSVEMQYAIDAYNFIKIGVKDNKVVSFYYFY